MQTQTQTQTHAQCGACIPHRHDVTVAPMRRTHRHSIATAQFRHDFDQRMCAGAIRCVHDA
ncbi:hypothetical protein, partial [Burkholderia stabilis]|uniref:hypothetical protein n=1 Tax=Burkholderia stabilis TaxID=95485 RepID=UPI001F4B84EE